MANFSVLVPTWWSECNSCLPHALSLTCLAVTLRWLKRDYTGVGTQVTSDQEKLISMSHGFGSVSRRHSLNKPIIAAVNGGAFGGGTEMVLNCDIVIAEENAKFALPEVKRGVLAAAGGIDHPPL
jgi:enoyl-CoA hydratase/carnithine racemase